MRRTKTMLLASTSLAAVSWLFAAPALASGVSVSAWGYY